MASALLDELAGCLQCGVVPGEFSREQREQKSVDESVTVFLRDGCLEVMPTFLGKRVSFATWENELIINWDWIRYLALLGSQAFAKQRQIT